MRRQNGAGDGNGGRRRLSRRLPRRQDIRGGNGIEDSRNDSNDGVPDAGVDDDNDSGNGGDDGVRAGKRKRGNGNKRETR